MTIEHPSFQSPLSAESRLVYYAEGETPGKNRDETKGEGLVNNKDVDRFEKRLAEKGIKVGSEEYMMLMEKFFKQKELLAAKKALALNAEKKRTEKLATKIALKKVPKKVDISIPRTRIAELMKNDTTKNQPDQSMRKEIAAIEEAKKEFSRQYNFPINQIENYFHIFVIYRYDRLSVTFEKNPK